MRKLVSFVAAASFAAPVVAHPGHDAMGFLGGVMHPLTGLDHLLAAVVVGLWAAQLGGRARWAVPASFVGAMTASAIVAAATGFVVPHFEAGIVASLICLGALVAFARGLPFAVALAVTAAFAVFHGAAHGSEGAFAAGGIAVGGGALVAAPAGWGAAAQGGTYLAGLILATAAVHASGLLASGGLNRAGIAGRIAPRAVGAFAAAAGLTLALT